jgi:hypothetical protein
VPTDRDDHDRRAARISLMLEALRLNTDDLYELAKQATDRSCEVAQAVRIPADDVRAWGDSGPTKKTPKPKT